MESVHHLVHVSFNTVFLCVYVLTGFTCTVVNTFIQHNCIPSVVHLKISTFLGKNYIRVYSLLWMCLN
jgi:hypothetical protein